MNTFSYRLIDSVRPSRYRISLQPDIQAATFTGRVVIDLTMSERCPEIRINCVDIDISLASLFWDGSEFAASVTYDPENEMAVLTTEVVPGPGHARLTMEFAGKLNQHLAGFYRSSYLDNDNNTVFIATTQFEATDARRAFPCFDEPDMKAVFEVELEVPSDHLAISNGAEISSENLGNGKKLVRFEPTIPMSTYLVAFIVGPLVATEPLVVRGVPLRIIHRPGWEHLTGFALEAGSHALEFFSDFFDIPYPASKLDLIAIPDFAAGAMENLGAVTFRESLLLVDKESASQPERERIVDVVSHEIAHMWFGDLVTMKWWNGLWLNEAFATYMETLATDHFEPAWRKWNSFGIFRATAQATDSLHSTRPIEYPVAHPSDCQGMFDIITYEKGGSVLRMLERHLGTEAYRRGISHYLNKYRFGNAETTDLWDSLEESTGEPVRALMDSWVFQGGLPVVSVSSSSKMVIARQEPFSFLVDRPGDSAIGERWIIPLAIRNLGNYDHVSQYLLDEDSAVIQELGYEIPIVNAHGHGYYRVSYSPELLAKILDSFESLDELERFGLIADTWAMVVAGRDSWASFLTIAKAYSQGVYLEQAGWAVIAQGLEAAAKARGEDRRDEIAATAAALFTPLLDALGTSPKAGEAETTGVLRALAISTMGILVRDREIIEFAREAFRAEMSREGSLEPSLASAILHTVAANADEADYAFVLDRFRHPESPIDEQRFLGALASFELPGLVSRTLALCLDGIRSQDAPYTVARLLREPSSQAAAFDFVVANYPTMLERYPESATPRMLEAMSALYSPTMAERADRVRGFLGTVKIPETGKRLAQISERYEANLALAKRLRENV